MVNFVNYPLLSTELLEARADITAISLSSFTVENISSELLLKKHPVCFFGRLWQKSWASSLKKYLLLEMLFYKFQEILYITE